MTDDDDWLALPDIAERMGIPVTRVRDLLRDRRLIAVRRGPNAALHVPASFLTEGEDGVEPHPWLRGTIMVLADAGLDDDEAMEWLLEPNVELGDTPIAALRGGKRAHVRRVAQALG